MTALHQNGFQVKFAPLGHAQTAVSSTPVALPSLPSLDKLRRVLIQPLDADIYWTDDGQNPSATLGQWLLKGSILVYDGSKPDQLKMVCLDGTADVRLAYYGL